MALPRVTRNLTDGNLERPTGNQKLNKHVLIIGTSADGPVYEPVKIRDINHAIEVFGPFGEGSLVRSIKEAIDAQQGSGGQIQITGVRIGGKYANKAFLNLDNSTDGVVLKLEALYPGDVYNDIAVQMDAENNIKIYNPKTDTWSVFSYSPDLNNTVVDVHNVVELADAINADPNLNGIILAEAVEKEAFFEINVNSTNDADVLERATEDETIVNLSAVDTTATTGDLVEPSRFLDGGSNQVVQADLDNPISAIRQVYAISESGIQELEISGKTKVKFDRFPLDGKNDSRFNTILNIDRASDSFLNLTKFNGTVDSTAYLRYRNSVIGKVEAGVNSWTFDAPWAIAHDDGVADAYGQSLGYDPVADAAVISTLKTPANSLYDANKPFKLEWRKPNTSANDWNEIVLASGQYTLSWDSTTKQLTLTITDATKQDELHQADGGHVRISYDSCIGFMSEKATLNDVQASTATFSDYFVRGQEVVFGDPLPANLVLRYATITYYDLGSTLEIEDATKPSLRLIGKGIQPGPGGGAIGADDVIIGFHYDYSPDMFTLSGTKSFSNGTNGTNLNNGQLYDELSEAYDRLDAYKFQILVVPGAYLDSTKTGFNEVTGLPQEVNAEFHILMSEFLNSYNGEAIGIIGFKPLKGTGVNGSVTRMDVKNRVEKLTEVDMSDPLRAANFLAPFDNKFMIAVDVEPIFAANGSHYTTTGEAWVAGHLARLEANESIYISDIPGAIGLRYVYSDKSQDGRSQYDALSDARIITAIAGNTGIRLTDGPTLARPGSDYERLTTVWIVQDAMNRVRAIAREYLGRPASMEILQAMETRLKKELGYMVPNFLQAFTFQIKSSPKQRVLGELEIMLVLVPVFEIRSIKVPVILKSDESQL